MMEHLMFLAGIIVIFLLIVSQALFLLSRFHLRFELAVPISLMLDMFVLLFFGLVFSNLLFGIYAIFGLTLFGQLFVFKKEKKRFQEFMTVFRSPGFIVFTIGYAFCWLVSLPQVPHAWDDFGHWFPFVKQMLNYDRLYSEPSVYLMKQWHYTPGISLLQYLFSRLVGGFSVVACYAVSTLIVFVSALPMMKWFESRIKNSNIFAVAVLFFSSFIVVGEDLDGFFLGFRSSYVDMHLTVVCILLLCWILFEKKSLGKHIYIGIIAGFLTMIKVTGVMFALLGIGTYLLFLLVEVMIPKKTNKGQNALRILPLTANGWRSILQNASAMLPLIMIVAVYLIWSKHAYPDIEFGAIIGMNANGFLQSVLKFGQGITLRSFELTLEWLRTYFFHFFDKQINQGALLPLNSSLVLVMFAGMIALKAYINTKKQAANTQLVVTSGCVLLGAFVYVLAIGISFYSFEENLQTMTSYKRYLSSYIGIMVMLSFVIGMWLIFVDIKLSEKARKIAAVTIVIGIIITMPVDFVKTVLGIADTKEYKDYYNNMSIWGNNVQSYMHQKQVETPKTFLIKTGHNGQDTPSLPADVAMPSYFILPEEVQDFGQLKYDPDSSLPFYSIKEWNDVLIEYNFTNVLIANYSIPSLAWQKADTEKISKMYSLFDCPPEELDYDAPLLFEINVDEDGQVHLNHILVENPIQ